MKKLLSIALFCFALSVNAQENKQFRIDTKQRAKIVKSGNSQLLLIETYLNNNEKSLANDKNPALSDPSKHIEFLKANKNLSKDICIECYENEYKSQQKQLRAHGLTDTKGFAVTVANMFFDQDSISIMNLLKMITSEAKNKLEFKSFKFTQGRSQVIYYDYETDKNTSRIMFFVLNKLIGIGA